ncbi:MAG: hypothetical protein RR740_00200 [Pseudomonas sp.]
MADMIDDVTVKEVWVSAHAVTGLTAGAALMLQNKGPFNVLMFIGAQAPTADSFKGYRIGEDREWVTDAGDTVWLRAENGSSTMCIQEA